MIATKNLDRRTFIKGASAVGALAASGVTAGVAFADEAAEEAASPYYSPAYQVNAREPIDGEVAFEADPVADADIVETLECDVAVVGAGISGVCTAFSAAENGLKVVLLEKAGTYQLQGGEIGSVNSKHLNEFGLFVDPVDYYNAAMEHASYRVDGRLWKVYIDRSGEALDWFIDDALAGDGGDWHPGNTSDRIGNGINWLADVISPAEGLSACVGYLFDKLPGMGAEVRVSTPGVQLVQEGDAVVGVIGKGPDGYIRVNAAKGVVLTTGGYTHNTKMMKERVRPRDLLVYSWLDMRVTDTGDGHLMGLAAGAIEDDYPHAMMNDDSGSISGGSFSAAVLSMFRVNERGERFVNEDIPLNFLANAIAYQPGCHDWCISDARVEEMVAQLGGVIQHGFAATMAENYLKDAYECASIAEMAEVIGCDEAVLQATIDRYNELCELGEDVDFHKTANNMFPILEPPYYIFDEGPINLSTVNGLRVNDCSEVLNDKEQAIPGLYAVGNVSGSMFSDTYCHHLAGVSMGRCVTFGYLLGRRLAGIE